MIRGGACVGYHRERAVGRVNYSLAQAILKSPSRFVIASPRARAYRFLHRFDHEDRRSRPVHPSPAPCRPDRSVPAVPSDRHLVGWKEACFHRGRRSAGRAWVWLSLVALANSTGTPNAFFMAVTALVGYPASSRSRPPHIGSGGTGPRPAVRTRCLWRAECAAALFLVLADAGGGWTRGRLVGQTLLASWPIRPSWSPRVVEGRCGGGTRHRRMLGGGPQASVLIAAFALIATRQALARTLGPRAPVSTVDRVDRVRCCDAGGHIRLLHAGEPSDRRGR